MSNERILMVGLSEVSLLLALAAVIWILFGPTQTGDARKRRARRRSEPPDSDSEEYVERSRGRSRSPSRSPRPALEDSENSDSSEERRSARQADKHAKGICNPQGCSRCQAAHVAKAQ